MTKPGATIDEIQAHIIKYYADFREPGLRAIELSSPPYDLKDDWDAGKSWPNCDKQGIYAILDADKKLLYVGKASMSSCIAARLSSWFQHDSERKCITTPGHVWKGIPAFVVSAAVPVERPWEASSLEEYLIHELDPIDNTAGRKNQENDNGKG